MAARAEVLVYIHFGVTFGGGACGGLVARRGPPRTGVVGTSAPACLSLLGGVRCDSSGLGLGLVAAADGRHALAAVLARGDDALADEEEDGREEEDGCDDDGDDDREGGGAAAVRGTAGGRGRGRGRGACRAVPEIAAARRAARRDEVVAGLDVAPPPEAAKVARERAVDLVVLEVPATPKVRSRAASGVGDAGGTRNRVSPVSWPISGGNVPVIWLLWSHLRRRGAVARRAGRRGRGGNSQLCRRRGIVGLAKDRDRRARGALTGFPVATLPRAARRDEAGIVSLGVATFLRDAAGFDRERAGDLVVLEPPATPRGGRAAAPGVGDAGETRSCPSFVSWPNSVGIGPSILLPRRYLRREGGRALRWASGTRGELAGVRAS